MNESEYLKFAAACDRLLTDPRADADRAAVAWLHVLSEHPANLRKYRAAVGGRRSLRDRIAGLWTAALDVRVSLLRMAESLLRSLGWTRQTEAEPAGARDVLVFSHLVNVNQLGGDDFYFGGLQKQLDERRLTSLVLLRNHTRTLEREAARLALRNGAQARELLPHALPLRAELRLWRRAWRISRDLRQAARSDSDPMLKLTARAAAWHALSHQTISNLRIEQLTIDLCHRLRPRWILATYEGHAWERCVWAAARSVDPDIVCVGYQHTVLWRHSHSVTRSLDSNGRRFDPDVVLTVGEATRDILARSGIPARLVVYGSHRRSDPGASTPVPAAEPRCLVLPEGIESESLTLFDFAVACARRVPELTFVFRTHPVLPFERLAARHEHLRSLPPNVVISSGATLDEDCRKASFALYRGSSTVLYAVLRGVKPYYVHRAGEIAFDPLFALDTWRGRVETAEEFAAAVIAHNTTTTADREREAETARAWADSYIMPPQTAALDEIFTPGTVEGGPPPPR